MISLAQLITECIFSVASITRVHDLTLRRTSLKLLGKTGSYIFGFENGKFLPAGS